MKLHRKNCVFALFTALPVSNIDGFLEMSRPERVKEDPGINALLDLAVKEIYLELSKAETLQVRLEVKDGFDLEAKTQKYTPYIVMVKNKLVDSLPCIEEVDVSALIKARKLDAIIQDRFEKALSILSVLTTDYENTEEVVFALGKKPNSGSKIYIDDEKVLRLANKLRKIKVTEGVISLQSNNGECISVPCVKDNGATFKAPNKSKKVVYIHMMEITTSKKRCDVIEVSESGELLVSEKAFELKYPEKKRMDMINALANKNRIIHCEIECVHMYAHGDLKTHSYSLSKIIKIFEPEFQLTR